MCEYVQYICLMNVVTVTEERYVRMWFSKH